MAEKRRAHVVLPKEMIDEIDSLVGKRGRSKFVQDALALQLINARQRKVFAEFTGFIDPADHPEWSTPEKMSEWVRASRQLDLERLERLWRPYGGL